MVKKRKSKFVLFTVWLCVLFAVGCKDKKETLPETNTLFQLVPSDKSNIHFSNQITEDYKHFFFDFNYVYNGGGVAIGDINNDGLADIYFTGNQVENKLYLNQGNFTFKDITKSAGVKGYKGWHNGVVMADVNADGLLDIYVCKGGFKDTPDLRKNELFINQGNLTFKEQGEIFNLDDAGYSTMASFYDMDNDNDLDMYLMNRPETFHLGFKQIIQGKKAQNDLYRDKLYINEGGSFKEIGISSGINANFGYGLGLSTSDLDNNGLADIFVSNDYTENDYLYFNKGNHHFKESIKEATNHIPFYGMGVDVVDFNNDGLEDIMELEMSSEDYIRSKTTMASMNTQLFEDLKEFGFHKQFMHNMLHLNQGNGFFSDVGQFAGIARTDWSWSCLGSDFDNDGFRDIFIGNGFLRDIWDKDTNNKVKRYIQSYEFRSKPRSQSIDYILQQYKPNKRTNYIYRNNGDLTFTNKVEEWGLKRKSFSNGAAVGDLDNDGDLDLVINNINGEAFIYNNKAELLNNNYLKVKLLGPDGNAFGLGAKIKLITNDSIQYHEFKTVRGYLSSVEPIIHFGLGTTDQVDTLNVVWPDGNQQVLKQIKSNQTIVLNYNDSNPVPHNKLIKNSLFKEATSEVFSKNFKHQENHYNDFKDQILLPHKLSQEGPCIAVGDLNNDGLDDFFIGGAKNQAGAIYIQRFDGNFIITNQDSFENDKDHEDVGATFFDFDNDGDLDLYVVSGGNEIAQNLDFYQDRLYENNGKGVFIETNNLPQLTANGSCVVPNDFDYDGDLDLFVGGRVIPGKYPNAAESYLLRNDKGKFIDVTEKIAPELKRIGMVTSAVWADINQDDAKELMIVGEWMPITVFEQEDGIYNNKTSTYNLLKTAGWWNTIEASDLDNDGDVDFVIGNLGLNYKFKTSEEKPFIVYANDFDDNGTNDVFLAKYYNNSIVPIRGKECSSQQIPSLKQKFKTYNEFAHADINQILGSKIQEATTYETQIFESVILRNENGIFSIETLPKEAQFSTVNSIIIKDLNTDGIKDIIIGGNKFETEIETTPADASPGYILLGLENGSYKSVPPSESGFFIPQNVKNIKPIKTKTGFGTLVGINNDTLKFFSLSN